MNHKEIIIIINTVIQYSNYYNVIIIFFKGQIQNLFWNYFI